MISKSPTRLLSRVPLSKKLLKISIYFRGRFTRRTQKIKSWHFLEATTLKIQKTGLASIKKRLSSSLESLNYQGRKKNYSCPQHQESRQHLDNKTHSKYMRKGTDSRRVSDLTFYHKNKVFQTKAGCISNQL